MALSKDNEIKTIVETYGTLACLEHWIAKLNNACSRMESHLNEEKTLSAAMCLADIRNYTTKISYLTRNEKSRKEIDNMDKKKK